MLSDRSGERHGEERKVTSLTTCTHCWYRKTHHTKKIFNNVFFCVLNMDIVLFQSDEFKKVSILLTTSGSSAFGAWPILTTLFILWDLSLRSPVMFWQCPNSKSLKYFLIPLGCIRPGNDHDFYGNNWIYEICASMWWIWDVKRLLSFFVLWTPKGLYLDLISPATFSITVVFLVL